MRILDLGALAEQPIDRHGSIGMWVGCLLAGPGAVTVVSLAPGGRIGRHPAPSPQLLLVLTGSVTVQGADGDTRTVGSGQAVAWEQGEQHETVTSADSVLLVVEGDLRLG